MTCVLSVNVGIAVDPHLIAEFAAQKLIHRHAVSLARQIPQSQLYCADAARLTTLPAELLDLAEEPVHFTGVFPYQTALEHFDIRRAASVAHLAVAAYSLIRFQFNKIATPRRQIDLAEFQIRNTQ